MPAIARDPGYRIWAARCPIAHVQASKTLSLEPPFDDVRGSVEPHTACARLHLLTPMDPSSELSPCASLSVHCQLRIRWRGTGGGGCVLSRRHLRPAAGLHQTASRPDNETCWRGEAKISTGLAISCQCNVSVGREQKPCLRSSAGGPHAYLLSFAIFHWSP